MGIIMPKDSAFASSGAPAGLDSHRARSVSPLLRAAGQAARSQHRGGIELQGPEPTHINANLMQVKACISGLIIWVINLKIWLQKLRLILFRVLFAFVSIK